MQNTHDRKKLFDHFLSGGFEDVNDAQHADVNIRHIASTYDWNYKQILPNDPNVNILDIGCGLGQFLFWAKEHGYKKYYGVDLSPEMIDFCRTHVTDRAQTIESVESFLQNKTAEYDVIVMNDVIEHLEKHLVVPYIEMMKRALKPGGMLLIKTNNVSAITGARMRHEDFTHETSFTEYSLRQVLRIAGFTQITMHAFDFPRTSFTRWIRYGAQSILHAAWRFVYFLEYTTVPKIVNEFFFAVAINDTNDHADTR